MVVRPAPASRGSVRALVGATHPGPTVAVTAVVALLGVAANLDGDTVLVVTGAVLAGQLTIGWGNDLVDAARDRSVGRADKPIADGRLDPALVRACLVAAATACVVLSLAAGWRSGAVHLVLGVGMGHAYNLGVKATPWSWLPYAVAFGSLPSVVALAGEPAEAAAWWLTASAAALGVGAHLLNTLPDLADDERTGVRGLPHRLGEATSRRLAVALLVVASAVAALGPAGAPAAWVWAALAVVGVLAAVAATRSGRVPFRAAIGVALVDVVLLVAR